MTTARHSRSATWRKKVTDRALAQVRGCLRDPEVYRELKEIVDRMISPEYQGRGLIELLQNAHDAHHARSSDGRVEIVLDEQEGEHGVLHVANGGRPFTTRDFNALCSIGRSSKRPDEGIGHKGVGFKSVLHFSEAPEFYSVARVGSRVFDGYCFRFALPDDVERLAARVAPDGQDRLGLLGENLPRLRVPIVLEEVPEAIRRFGSRGFVTVVRVPFHSPEARQAARGQIRELMDDGAPFELFLDRLARVTLDIRSADGKQRKHFDRHVRSLYGFRGLKVQEITLRERRMRLIVVRARVDEELARAAIAPGVRDGSMSPDWKAWERKAEVCVAVPVGEPLPDGRVYTFLPMGAQASCPVPAYVHAPFFAELNRRSFNEVNPWNDLLLNTAATACARAVLLADDGRIDVPAGALVDLMCWTPAQRGRLDAACTELGHDMDGIPFMPVLAPAGERTSLRYGYLWKCPDASKVFTPATLAAIDTPHLVDPGLQPVRLQRLLALAKDRGLPLTPTPTVTRGWAVHLAEAMQRDAFDAARWADYYADLTECFPDGSVLSGKRIIFTSEETLVPAGDDTVFLEQSYAGASALPALPSRLSGQVSFLHGAIDSSGRRGRRRSAGRRWLRTQHLVHTYEPETVLRAVGSVMRQNEQDEETRRQCLLYACAVSGTLTSPPRLADLPVPVRGGWLDAGRAMFGRGWPGKQQQVDDTLVRFLDRVHGVPVLEATAAWLLRTPDEICAGSGVSVDAMRRFLEHQGVRHGLRPCYEPFRGSVRGSVLNSPEFFAGLSHPDAGADFRHQWRAAAQRWPNRGYATYETVDYAPSRTALPVLPGQYDYAALDDHGRKLYAELIVHGLATWGDTDLEMRFVRRPSDARGTAWPTPLAVFLSQASWIPQAQVGTDNVIFAAADTAWWWSSEQPPPEYISVVTAALRRGNTSKVLDRLHLLGIRSWDAPGTARDRLEQLPALVELHPHLSRGVQRYEVSRAYETAWSQLLPAHEPPAPSKPSAPARLLVTRSEVLEVYDGGAEASEIVYVPDPQGVQEHKLLERAPVPVLPIRDKALGRRIEAYLSARSRFDVRRASAAELDISAGVLPVRQVPRQSLVGYVGTWLNTLVTAVVDLDEERASRQDPVPLPAISRRLQACEFTVTQDLVVWIAGHRVDVPDTERCLLHQDPEGPCLVVQHKGPLTPWAVLRRAATALSTLIGAPYLAMQLSTSLSELADRCLRAEEIGDEDIAVALGIPLERLESVVADRASRRSGSAQLVPLLACVDIDGAEELRRRMENFHDRAELRDWLAHRLDPDRADMLLGLLDDDDHMRQLAALEVPLATANRAWRTLGLPVIDNRARHHRQFEAWLEKERPALQERVRDAYAHVFRSGGALTDYVRLRELPGLVPDPEWHTEHWDLTPELLASHADRWAVTHLPRSPGRPAASLRPLAEVREGAIGAIHTQLPRLRALVEEWARYTGEEAEPLPDATEIVQERDGEGLLDFEITTARDLVNWLSGHGHWPAGMPITHRRADLELTGQRPPIPAQRPGPASTSGSGNATAAPPSSLVLNGRPLPNRRDDLRELALKVAADLTDEQLATPALGLATLGESRSARTRTSTGQRTGGSAGYRAAPPDQEKNTSVGLAGEAAVARWLEWQFGAPPEVTWKSSLRSHVLAGEGDDSLGYDFRVHKDG